MEGLMYIGAGIVLGLLTWLIAFLVIRYEYPKRDAYYSGKQLMTEDEFLTFKNAAVDTDVSLSCVELNSRAPIYVDFHVTLPHTKIFPFGERSEETKLGAFSNNAFGFALCFFLCSGSIIALTVGVCKLFGLPT